MTEKPCHLAYHIRTQSLVLVGGQRVNSFFLEGFGGFIFCSNC